jgi:DNA-binding CsgD family transcriptional regulator
MMLAAARLSAAGPDRDRRTTHAALAAWGSGQSDLAHDLGSRLPTATESATTARLVWLHGLLEIAGSDPITAFARLERLAGGLAPAAPEHAAMLRLLAVTAAYDAGELAAARRAASAVEQAGGPSRRLGELFGLALEGRLPVEGSEPSKLLAALPAEVHKRPGMADSVVMVLGGLGPHLVLTREFGVSACAAQRSAGVFGTLAVNLLWLTDVHLQLGHCDDAADCAEEVLRLTRDSGQRSGSALALAHLARVAAIRGEHGRCRELAAEALTIAVATRARGATAHATWAVALAALAEGDAHEACDRIVLLIEPGSPFFHELIAMRAAPDLVEAAVRTGQLPLAHRVTAQLAGWAERSTLPWARAYHDRCLALIAEDDDEAHRLFARASEVAASSNRPFDLARTALLRGEALRRDRRRVEARTPLRLAVELFDGQGARRWAEIARSQLRGAGGLGTSPRDDRPVSAVLTAQELQVARLAASGLSNKEIGALLFVSPRTVAYHLYKIFPKLGISARSQLRSVVLDDTGDADAGGDDMGSGDTVDAYGHREPPVIPV